MDRRSAMVLAVLATTSLVACAAEKQPAPAASAAPGGEAIMVTEAGDGSIGAAQAVSATATVVAIDQKTRMVTLRGEDGEEFTFKAGDEVRNLPQVRKGDQVVATYYESIAVQLKKPGEATPGVTAAEEATRAKQGEMPAAAGARTVTLVATVEKVDKKKQTVTLVGPKGRKAVVAVKDPARFEKVKVGDLVEVTYTEAIGISVERARK